MPLPLTENAVDLADSEIFQDVGVAYMNTSRATVPTTKSVSYTHLTLPTSDLV